MDLVRLVQVGRAAGHPPRAQDSLEAATVPAEDGQGQVLVAAQRVLLAGVKIHERHVEHTADHAA